MKLGCGIVVLLALALIISSGISAVSELNLMVFFIGIGYKWLGVKNFYVVGPDLFRLKPSKLNVFCRFKFGAILSL